MAASCSGDLDGAPIPTVPEPVPAAGAVPTAYITQSANCGCPSGVSLQILTSSQLGGVTLSAGCYHAVAAYGLTGQLTLDGQGAYIFTSSAAISTALASAVVLTNGATCGHVNWCTVGAATIGAVSLFNGNIRTGIDSSVTLGDGSIVHGSVHSGSGIINVGAGATIRADICSPTASAVGFVAMASVATSTPCGCPAGSSPHALTGALGGLVLTPGCYTSVAAFTLTGDLTLSGAGAYTFVGQAAFTTAASSHVRLANGASCDHVEWCLTGALTVGASSTLYGSALTGPTAAITLGAGSTVRGSLTAGNGIITIGAGVNLASCNES